jgi:hypothetical protein
MRDASLSCLRLVVVTNETMMCGSSGQRRRTDAHGYGTQIDDATRAPRVRSRTRTHTQHERATPLHRFTHTTLSTFLVPSPLTALLFALLPLRLLRLPLRLLRLPLRLLRLPLRLLCLPLRLLCLPLRLLCLPLRLLCLPHRRTTMLAMTPLLAVLAFNFPFT